MDLEQLIQYPIWVSQPHCDLVPPWARPAYDLPCKSLPRWLLLHVPLGSPCSPFVSDRVGVVHAYLARVAITGAPRPSRLTPAISLGKFGPFLGSSSTNCSRRLASRSSPFFRHPPFPPFILYLACYITFVSLYSLSRRISVCSGSRIVVSSSSVLIHRISQLYAEEIDLAGYTAHCIPGRVRLDDPSVSQNGYRRDNSKKARFSHGNKLS
jgi:hypothetical protein